MILQGCLSKPINSLAIILFDAQSVIITIPHMVLRTGGTVTSGLLKPICGLSAGNKCLSNFSKGNHTYTTIRPEISPS